MAIYQNDPFGIGDYSNYASWKQVKMPDGQIYYEVPGNPGYVFDPVASRASGRQTFRKNPQLAITQQEEEQKRLKEIQEQEAFNRSPTGQLLPVAGSTAGLIAASQIMKPGASAVAITPQGVLMSDGAIKGGAALQSAAPAITTPAITTPAQAAASGAIAPATPNLVGATAVPTQAAAPTVLGNAAGMGVLPLAAIAAGTYLAGDAAYDMYKGKKANPIGRGVLGIATGGLSEIAKATGLLGHKSTRERQSEVTDRLISQAGNDQNAINYVTGMREQFNSAPPDPSKPFAGKYGSWDEYVKGGLEAGDLTGVEGNIETYTPQVWANLTQEQRQAVTQANIDAGIYNSKDGGVQITDKTKAKENFDAVMKGFDAGVKTATNPAQAAAAGAMRSNTLSPGIGLDGLPIKKLNPSLRR